MNSETLLMPRRGRSALVSTAYRLPLVVRHKKAKHSRKLTLLMQTLPFSVGPVLTPAMFDRDTFNGRDVCPTRVFLSARICSILTWNDSEVIVVIITSRH